MRSRPNSETLPTLSTLISAITDCMGRSRPNSGTSPNLNISTSAVRWVSGMVPPELSDLRYLDFTPFDPEVSPCKSPVVVDQTLEALVADCEALWGFFKGQESMKPIGSQRSNIWGDTNPLEDWDWVFVTEGRVTGFNIADLDSIDPEVRLTADLGNLSGLEFLSACGLYGSLPAELGKLTNLKEIRIIAPHTGGAMVECRNFLEGPIPPELGNLTNLEVLNISDNSLTGPIPPELGTSPTSKNCVWTATPVSAEPSLKNSATSSTSRCWTSPATA